MTKEQLDAIRARQVRAKKAFTTIQLSLMDIPAMLDEITELKAENAELRRRCEAALSDLKGDCASCAKKGKNVNVCRKCIDSETYDEYKWRGEEGENQNDTSR